MLKTRPTFRVQSIGSLLILSVTVTVALAMAAIIFYVTRSSYNLTLEIERHTLAQAGITAQRGLDQYCDFAISLARSMATDRQVTFALGGDPDRAQWRLTEAVKATPAIWSVLVFDVQGQVVAGVNANGDSLAGGSRADRDYCKAILSGKDQYLPSSIILSKTGGDAMYIFTAGHSIRDATGQVMGGVVISLKWSAFTDRFITPLRFGQWGYAYMIDGSGVTIAHGANKAAMLKNDSSADFMQKVLAQKNGQQFYEWKGTRKFMSFSQHPDTGFIFCMTANEGELTAAAATQRNILVGIGVAAMLLLAACITFILRRLVVKPIQGLQSYADAVAHGDYNAAKQAGLRFEIAALADNLYSMVGQLKERLGYAQGVLEGFVLPCAVFDRDDKATFINEHMLKALEKDGTVQSRLGESSAQFIWGDASRTTLVNRVQAEGRLQRAEIPFPTKSGLKVFDATCAPIKDLDGNVIGTLAVWFELTEIRAQQKHIEEQNARIAKAAAAANTVSDQVASASEELAAQIEQSSRGSEEQRSHTAEAATAMTEMNSTVMEVAKNAGSAAELAERTKARAEHGAQVVEQAVTTITRVAQQAEGLKADMGKLGKQAEDIGQILEVISDIADQTNLLALNAAIEAARAGDAGRGFAVVADEVRKLAEKTMQATNEVGGHIRSIQDSARSSIKNTEATTTAIQESTGLADKSGAALREIVGMVDQTADQVRGIATASEQQSAASEEISRSTEVINRIAGETSEAMVQSGKAVSDLARLAQELRTIINDMNG